MDNSNKNYISGVHSPKFKIGDKVRLRTPEEIDEENISPFQVVRNQQQIKFDSYREFMKHIIATDKEFKAGEIYTIEDIGTANDHDLLTIKGKDSYIVAWPMISVNERTTNSSTYRTTKEGFKTNDDNWLPENRWF